MSLGIRRFDYSPAPRGRYWSSYALRLILAGAVLTLLILVNREYLFHTNLYEADDLGANTLSVVRASGFRELHGPYSRWQFHHPGPALFYGEAAGEGILHRALHLTPTPYNAQVLTVMGLLACFFAAGISVAARWVRGGAFVALALAFAAIHFSAVGGRLLLTSTWSAYVIPLIFFGWLMSAASVGAGQGEDLPLLALAGGFLLHLHVAQPLFVVPLCLLVYGGLAWSCHRRRVHSVDAPVPLAKEGETIAPPPSAAKPSVFPWRVYRFPHALALLIAGAFALPILLDALFPRGNLRQILTHLHDHRGEGHPFLDSLTYFLHFAVYRPSLTKAKFFAGAATQRDLLSLVVHHPEMFLLWAGALLSPLLALAARLWRGPEPVLLGTMPEAAPAGYASPAGRWRFLGWLWVVWFATFGLTLTWGHLQDGEMFYFNAWFNYSIWYVLALLAAGSLADALDTFASRSERPLLWKGSVVFLCAAGICLTLSRHADRFRADAADGEGYRVQQGTVARALATEPAGTPRAKLLVFPHDAWESATGIAALLARRSDPVYVLPNWTFMFGEDHALPDWQTVFEKPAEANPAFEVWHLVPLAHISGESLARPLLRDFALVPGGLPVDPAKNPAITWTGENPNFEDFVGLGWAPPGGGPVFAMTVEHHAVIQFRAVPIPSTADAHLTFDLKPYLIAGKRDSQRMTVHYNGHDLGTFQVGADESTAPQAVVPAAVWNRYPSGLLTLDFPDAISQREADDGDDLRAFAFDMHRISFGLLMRVELPAPVPVESSKPAEPPVVVPDAPKPAADPEPPPMPTGEPEPTPLPGTNPELAR